MRDIAGHVVGVRQRASHRFLQVQVTGPGSGHPQAETHGGRQIGHGRTSVCRTGDPKGRPVPPGHAARRKVPPMSDVLALAEVSVVRGDKRLLDSVTWEVEEGERWVVLGPNGAGKTTLLQVAAARMHPSSGVAGVLTEVLGTVDVFELRPRIGLASASIAERIPNGEIVADVVVTAAYGMLGRWREQYDELDHQRAAELLEA